jgi:hypothetical protein
VWQICLLPERGYVARYKGLHAIDLAEFSPVCCVARNKSRVKSMRFSDLQCFSGSAIVAPINGKPAETVNLDGSGISGDGW